MITISDHNIDVGEVHYAPDQSSSTKTRVITLTNNNTTATRIHIDHFKSPSPESPVYVNIHELDDGLINDSTALNRYFDVALGSSLIKQQSEDGSNYIIMNPNETKSVVVVLSPIFFNNNDGIVNLNRQDYARTSFFKVIVKLVLRCENYELPLSNNSIIDKFEVNVSATLCTSILYVDETDIEFDSCIVGEMYVRDMQVWNRSECPLAFKITPVCDAAMDGHQVLSFQEFDTGRIIPYDRVINVPAFASKRLRVVFRANELGVLKITLRLENMNNSTNNSTITCRINVIDVTDNDSLVLELESGQIVGTGQTLELGDCYCGMTFRRRLWVKNISKDTVILDISSDNPSDIRLDFSGHIPDTNPESIKLNLIMNEKANINSVITEDITDHDHDHDHDNDFVSDYNSSIYKTKTRHEPGDTDDGDLDADNQAKHIKPNFQIPKKIKEALISSQGSAINSKTDTWGERSNRTVLSFVPTYGGKSDYNSDDDMEGYVEHKRFFIDSPKSFRKYEGSTKSEEKIQDSTPDVAELRKKIENSKSNDQEASNASPLVVPPGQSKPITLIYSPTYKAPNDEGAYDSKRQKNDLTASGSLISKYIKLFLCWRIKASDIDLDIDDGVLVHKHGGQHVVKGAPETYSRLILCKARTCLSLVTVMPNVIDLGECSVGDYRSSTFTIVNESDLAALIYPYVESETLSVTESEIRVPPRQRKQILLEYVARVENTDYNKKVALLNAYNPNSNISFEVRAKNVDTHKVLLHSLFYKLNTHNSKRQLQLFFDTCLTSMQNMRIFSIKNIHSDALKLELLTFGNDENADVRILLIVPMTKYVSTDSIITNQSSSGDHLSKRIEDLKWGSPFEAQVSKRSGSFGQDDDFNLNLTTVKTTSNSLQSKGGSESNSTDNISDVLEAYNIKKSGSETNLNVATTKVRNFIKEKDVLPQRMDLITQVDKWGFPFSLINSNVEASKNAESSSVNDAIVSSANNSSINSNALHTGTTSKSSIPVDVKDVESSSISTIQSLYREMKELVEKRDFMIPLNEDGHIGAVTIPPGITYNFAVLFEPKSQDTADELESSTVHREIQIRLLSVDTSNIVKNVEQAHKIHEPIKPRILPIKAKVVRSEMTVLQKNISFGKTIVGEQSTRGVTIVNKSSVPCIYSISKSGSISSGFLKILSGRKGVVAPMSSHTLEFAFKPTLAGSFEETVHIENVLHPTNIQSIVVKAKVSKPESFQLLSSIELAPRATPDFPQVESNLLIENQDLDVVQKLKRDLDEELSKSDTSEGKSTNATFLGDVAVGESCDILIAFKIRNVTLKSRQFIVDASHSDAITLLFSESLTSISNIGKMADANKSNVPFEPIPDTLQSVVNLSCRFLEVTGDETQSKLSVQETERIALEDKLEHFQQKLKIAYRKNKPDKIAKYEKKVKEAMAMLSGEPSDSAQGNIGEDDDSGNEGEKKKSKKDKVDNNDGKVDSSIVHSSSTNVDTNSNIEDSGMSPLKTRFHSTVKEVVGESDMAFHISIPAEQDALIQIKVTFLPGSSYRHWIGPLPFKGYFRVFECRNEDLVKKVPFGAMLFPSKHALSESLIPTAVATSSTYGVEKIDSPNRILSLVNDSTSKEMGADVVMHQNTFLTTVAQWSSFPTKQMFPRYRQLPVNVLGMSVKLVQASKEKIMQGSVSIASLIREEASVFLSIVHDIKFPVETSVDHILYNPTEHGLMRVSHSVESMGQGEIEDVPEADGSKSWKSKINPGGKVVVTVQWQPSSEMRQRVMIMSVLAVRMEISGKRIGNIQYIPIICFLEYKSNFKVDKNLFFGEVPLGSVSTETVTITNLSETDELHYITTLATATPSVRTIGNIEISTGQTGVLAHSSSKEIRVSFNATSVGKFEQELWIWNLRDQFDQKRVVLSSTVIVPQSQFVVFPDIETDKATGKLKRLELGLIQIQSNYPSDNLSSTSYDYVYQLRIHNVSDKTLAVTALSNLRSQCFIFTDSSCLHPVVSLPMPPLLETILYVVIRPSSLTSDQSFGRDLIGGIRLVFFAMNDDTQSTSTTSEDSVQLIARKLFETTVVFRAIVGCSILRIRSSHSKSHLIGTKRTVSKSDMQLKTLGTIMLQNLSPTFTLNYFHMTAHCDYVMNNDVIFDGRKVSNRLIIFDNAEGILEPNECKEVKYGIIFDSSMSGLMKYTIKIQNSNTGDVQLFSNTIFFDNGSIVSTASNKDESVDGVSFLGAFRHIYAHRITAPSQLISGRRGPSPANANTDIFIVTGSEGLVLLQYTLENKATTPLTISPFSEMPISVSIELVNAQIPNSIQTNTTLKREGGKSYNSLLSLSTGTMDLGKYRKCGETAIVPPGEKATVIVRCNKGAEISDDLLSNLVPQLDSFGVVKATGAIAFVSSRQMISSFFDPKPSSAKASVPVLSNLFDPPSESDLELKPPKPPSSDSELVLGDDVLPFLHYCEVECKFVVPRLTVPSKNINLMKVRDGRQYSFNFPIYNSCDVSIPIALENLPSWLSINDQTMVIPPKESLLLQIIVTPSRSESKVLEDLFFIRNLALSSDGISLPEVSGEDLVGITVRVEVDATDIMGLTVANGNTCQKAPNGNHFLDVLDVLTIPPSVPTVLGMRIYFRNNMSESINFTSKFILNPIFENMIELDILNQNSSISGQPIDLIAGETIECKIICRAYPGTRMPSMVNDGSDAVEVITSDNNDIDDKKNTEQKRFDVFFGTLQLFTSVDNGVSTKEKPSSPSVKTKVEVESLFMDVEAIGSTDFADLSIDILGHLEHGATTVVSSFADSSDTKTEGITFKAIKVTSALKQAEDNENINDGVWSPQLRLEDDGFKVQLHNPSASETIAFRVSSLAYRHAGMRLSLQKADDGTYDTVIARAYPSSGLIPPSSDISLSIRLEPSSSQENSITIPCRQDQDRDELGFMAVMRMLLKITDDNYPLHPPLVIQSLLVSDVLLPVIVAQPVSDTNRKKLHLDTYHDGRERLRGKGEKSKEADDNRSTSPWELGLEKDISSTTAASFAEDRAINSILPTIRLRGVTPCLPMKGQFEICLGQHIQRSESIEWLMTLENCSNTNGMRFNISSLSENDERWLLIGQTRGSIPAGGSTSITLYFSRLHLGIFFTYLVLENLSNPQDLKILRVSMEVVNDGKDRQLFAVQTTVNGLTWNQSNQLTRKGESSHELHQIHYGDIYFGRQYRRRFIILVNLSDTLSLDFQLSSTIGANIVTFTLSPLSLKPCTMVTLAPLEKRQVYVVFRPFVPLLYNLLNYNNDNVATVDNSTKKLEVEQSFSNKQIKGEICISCRLIKDHQETIKIYGLYKSPVLRVSLELPQNTNQTNGIESLTDHFIQLSNETNVEVGDGVESVIKLNAGSSRLDKNMRWSHSQHICIRNKDPEDNVISIFSIMQYFTVQVDDVFTKDMENVTNLALSSKENNVKLCDSDWTLDSVRIKSTVDDCSRMIQHVNVPGEGCLWLSLHSNVEALTTKTAKKDEQHDSLESFTEAKNKIQYLKENPGEEGEYFMIYLRRCPTEKYRVSVRIDPHVDMDSIDPIISSKFLPSSLAPIYSKESDHHILQHSEVSTIAPLESAISLYLKQFNAIWSSCFDTDTTSQQVPFAVDIDNNIDIKSMLRDICNQQDIKFQEDVIYIESNKAGSLSTSRKRAVALAECFFSFVALTDQLILQRYRQSNHSSTASTINQPATTLAHLLYLILFRHPVFEAALDMRRGKETKDGIIDASNRSDLLLLPFFAQFSQYMAAFPDMNPDDPLVRIWLSYCNEGSI